MTIPSASAPRRRRRTRAQRPRDWLDRLWDHVPLVEVCLTRPSWRQAMVVGSLTLLTLGSSGASLTASPPSAAQAQPEPTATAPAADPTAQDSPDPVAVWRNPPQTYEVRPPAPGQQIQDVTFLADGRLAIRVQAPDGYQEWLHEPATGARSHVATCKDPCALEPDGTVAVDPDLPDAIMRSTAWQIVLRQGSAADAEQMAAPFGTVWRTDIGRSSDGRTTARVREEPRVYA